MKGSPVMASIVPGLVSPLAVEVSHVWADGAELSQNTAQSHIRGHGGSAVTIYYLYSIPLPPVADAGSWDGTFRRGKLAVAPWPLPQKLRYARLRTLEEGNCRILREIVLHNI